MLKKFLLGRGANKLQQLANKLLRHFGGTAAGTYLLTHDLATASQVDEAGGALLVLASVGISIARAVIDKRV